VSHFSIPESEDELLAETILERSKQPAFSWDVALEQLGITEDQVDAVDLSKWTIEG